MASFTLPMVSRNLPRVFLCSNRLWRPSAYRDLTSRMLPVASSILSAQSQCRFLNTTPNDLGVYSSIKERLGIKKLRYRRRELHHSGMRLYLCIAELLDFDEFQRELDMEDTFASWFRLIELHTWLVMVRLGSDGDEGMQVRNSLSEYLWKDIDKRSRKLGPDASSTARRESIQLLSSEFKFALFSYDEGMLSDDRVLAGALWRTFFQKRIVTPKQLETMVAYVRKQQHHLHQQPSGVILQSGLVTFLPLYGEEEDEERTRKILDRVLNRS